MQEPPLDVSSLEIVGYSDVLSSGALPSIVPPIFRRKGAVDSVLVAPYSFNGRYLCDATEISVEELESLEHRREVTMLPAPIDARKGYELWVNPQGLPQYQTRSEARHQLDLIASQELKKASTAFADSQLDEAERHSSVALLADEHNLEAMAIKIAIATVSNDSTSAEILRELVAQNSLNAISARITELCNQYYKARPVAVTSGCHSIMRDVAMIRPRP